MRIMRLCKDSEFRGLNLKGNSVNFKINSQNLAEFLWSIGKNSRFVILSETKCSEESRALKATLILSVDSSHSLRLAKNDTPLKNSRFFANFMTCNACVSNDDTGREFFAK